MSIILRLNRKFFHKLGAWKQWYLVGLMLWILTFIPTGNHQSSLEKCLGLSLELRQNKENLAFYFVPEVLKYNRSTWEWCKSWLLNRSHWSNFEQFKHQSTQSFKIIVGDTRGWQLQTIVLEDSCCDSIGWGCQGMCQGRNWDPPYYGCWGNRGCC